ncbi:unnamed protein product [Protopolystoma xenopodis]|uniref:Uncharacterized protein n=1 Tax=Protopolystoma xenopodis TaxID=117903 RepID=A0A3S5AKR9_9PLAT|nr:unnamed protein product [Protopolystoma xenopodis]
MRELQRDQEKIKQLEIKTDHQMKVLRRKQEEIQAARRTRREVTPHKMTSSQISEPMLVRASESHEDLAVIGVSPNTSKPIPSSTICQLPPTKEGQKRCWLDAEVERVLGKSAVLCVFLTDYGKDYLLKGILIGFWRSL